MIVYRCPYCMQEVAVLSAFDVICTKCGYHMQKVKEEVEEEDKRRRRKLN